MKKEERTFSHKMQYYLIRVVTFCISLVPLRCALAFGACLGWFAWRVVHIRSAVVLKNLTLAFPDKTEKEHDRIAVQSYINTGRFMMEFARQKRVNRKYIEKYIEIDDEALQQLRNLDTGCLIISGHYGNWELYAIAFAYLLDDHSLLVGELKNSLVDAYINELRASHVTECFDARGVVRGVFKVMKCGGTVLWLSDQEAGKDGIKVDFFGYPASTPRGAAAFSVKLNVPVVLGVLVRKKGPYQKLILFSPIYPDPKISREDAEKKITQEYTAELEKMIRMHPEMYWWVHRRWKSTGLYRKKKKRETNEE